MEYSQIALIEVEPAPQWRMSYNRRIRQKLKPQTSTRVDDRAWSRGAGQSALQRQPKFSCSRIIRMKSRVSCEVLA